MLRISLRCKLNVLYLFWAIPWACVVIFYFFTYMQLFLSVTVFNVWSWQGKRGEEGIERHFCLLGRGRNSGGRCSSGGRLPLWLHLCGQKPQSVSEHRPLIFGGQGPFCPPGSCRLLQTHMHSLLLCGWGGCVGVPVLRPDMDQSRLFFPWNLQACRPPQS